MKLFAYDLKARVYLDKTIDDIGIKKFEEIFSKYPVIKLEELSISQPLDVEDNVLNLDLDQDLDEDLTFTADEVKPEVDIISSNDLDLSSTTSLLQSKSYFLRTRETKRPKYVEENEDTLMIYSNYLEKVPAPVLRIERLPQELFHQALQRLEELKQNKDTQTNQEQDLQLGLDPNGIKQQKVDESQNVSPQVEKQPLPLQLQFKAGEVKKELNNNNNDDSSTDISESEHELESLKKKKIPTRAGAGNKRKNKYVSCNICSKTFNRPIKLANHLETHISKANREKNVICQVCQKGFYSKINLKNHIYWAHNENDIGQEYLCPHCGKVYSKKIQFQEHVTSHSKQYKCAICDQVFKQKFYLTRHEHLHNNLKPQIKCLKCFKLFSRQRSLNSHYLRMHSSDETSLTCSYDGCGKSFCGQFNLENHAKSHKNEPIKCPHCHLVHKSKSSSRQHIYRKHKDKVVLDFDFKCTFENCSRSFYSSLLLERHLKKHENIINRDTEPVKRWLCTQCGKPFRTKEHLGNHLLSHGSGKNFKCPHNGCEKVFKYPSHSRSHFRIEHEMNNEERTQYFKEMKVRRSTKAKEKQSKVTNKEKN